MLHAGNGSICWAELFNIRFRIAKFVKVLVVEGVTCSPCKLPIGSMGSILSRLTGKSLKRKVSQDGSSLFLGSGSFS